MAFTEGVEGIEGITLGPLYTTTATSYQVSVGVTYYTKKRERSIRTQHTNPLYPMIVLAPRESDTHR